MKTIRILPFLLENPRVAFNAWYLRKKGVELGPGAWISGRVYLALAGNSSLSIGSGLFVPRTAEVLGNDSGRIQIGNNVTIGTGARLHVANRATLRVADGVGIGPYNFFNAFDDLSIGEDTMFGPMVVVNCADHGTRLGTRMREQDGKYGPVSIGADCWLGAQVVVLKGVKIGDGAVIGAGAVVTKDVPEYTIAAGVPAEVIRERK